MDPEKEVGTDALGAKVSKVDDNELSLKAQVLHQIIAKRKKFKSLEIA